MRSVRLCILVLGLVAGREIAEAAEPAGGLSPVGEAVVEGATGTGSFVGAGAEIGFAGVPGLAVGSEFLLALGGEGWGPGIRFAVRYYVW